MKNKFINESQIIKEFLGNFNSKSTITAYKCHLRQFFELLQVDSDDYIKDVRKMENGKRIYTLDSYEKDIRKFSKWLITTKKKKRDGTLGNYAPKTISNAQNCIRVFLKQYRIQLDDIFWEELNRRGIGNKPITDDKPLTKPILKNILNYATVQDKAMFMTMASGGMRENELVQITFDDIEWDRSPVKINIKHTSTNRTKGKYSRYTFISNEAAQVLKQWIERERKLSIDLASRRTNLKNIKHMNKEGDDRVFPYHKNLPPKHWRRLLLKVGFDKKDVNTGINQYHCYMLRKYFRTNMGKYDSDLAKFLMGHKDALTEAYVRKTEDEIRQSYQEGMSYLNIYEVAADLSEHTKQIEQLEKSNSALQNELEDLKYQILQLQIEKQAQNGKNLEELVKKFLEKKTQ